MKYSLVIPVYKNKDSIQRLLDRITSMNKQLDGELEAVFVVDGCPEGCFGELDASLPRVNFQWQLQLLSRNYGAIQAVKSGLTAAAGEYMAVMSADLQEPEELFFEFFNKLATNSCDVVLGVRESRDDPLLTRSLSQVFWWLYRKFILPEIPKGGVDVFGCNNVFRDNLILANDSSSAMVGQIFLLGFQRGEVSYHRQKRVGGKSAWTVSKKINYLLDSVFSFTDIPIKFLIGIGFVSMLFSMILLLLIVVSRMSGVIQVPGYSSTIVVILFFAAINAVGLGVIGSYVWRVYTNLVRRHEAIVMLEKHG